MGRNMRLLRSVYYKLFITKRYIKVGEIEKNLFSITLLLNGPFKGVLIDEINLK